MFGVESVEETDSAPVPSPSPPLLLLLFLSSDNKIYFMDDEEEEADIPRNHFVPFFVTRTGQETRSSEEEKKAMILSIHSECTWSLPEG